MIKDHKDTGENRPVMIGKVDSLTVYEITDFELDQLEQGENLNIDFNIAIFLLSMGLSYLSVLFTVSFNSNVLLFISIAVTLIGIIGGIIMLISWYIRRKPTKKLVLKIKNRLIIE